MQSALHFLLPFDRGNGWLELILGLYSHWLPSVRVSGLNLNTVRRIATSTNF